MTDEPNEPHGRKASPVQPRRHKWWLVLGGAALVVRLSWQLGMWKANPPEARSADVAAGSGDYSTGLTIYPPARRPTLPDLTGPTLDGEQLDVQELAGNVVVLNVWGSWCGPCRAEAPDLARVSRETSDEGVKFVGIDTRDTADAARAFMRSFHIAYPSLVDKQGELLLNLNGVIPVTAVPSTVVVDDDGNIAAKIVGRVDYPTLNGIITDLLRERRRSAQSDRVGS